MSAPALRFKGFTQPWSAIRVGNVGEIITGNTPSTSEPTYYGGNKLFVSPADISSQRYISNTKTTLTESGFSKGRLVKENSILFVCIGSTIGKLAQNKVDCITNQQINAIVPSAHFHAGFIYSRLEMDAEQISLLAGKQAVPIINKTSFSKVLISVPSLAEQTKIANFLTAVDEKLVQITRKHDLLTQYKKGVMQQIFSQELRFKDDDGQEFPEWEETYIGKVLTIGSGKDYKHLSSGEIPVYGTGGYMLSVNNYLYDGESVCIGRKGTIDKPTLLSGKFWTVDTLFYTHTFKNCLPKFIYAYFQTIDWKNYNEASGVPSLSKSTIEKIEIRIPVVAEQTKIANFLTAIDEKISATKAQLEAVKQYKQGLLQQMFV